MDKTPNEKNSFILVEVIHLRRSKKYDQFCDPPLTVSTKINSRSIV